MAPTAQAYQPRAHRFPIRVPLHYRKSGMEYWQDGKTINISRTGILFQADETIPTDSVLDIQVSLPLKATLSCQCSVVRAAEESALAVRIHRYHLVHG
jgi:hypothetical protein